MQPAKQSEQQSAHELRRGGNPAWVPGQSQYPQGRETNESRAGRIREQAEQLTEPLGGMRALSEIQRSLAFELADLLLTRRPRAAPDRVRRVNSIARLTAQLGLAAPRNGKRLTRLPAR